MCLAACGIKSERKNSDIILTGGTLTSPDRPLDCGNSGTAARLLSGLLAGQGIAATLTGDPSLSRRPMKRIIHPLRTMQASVRSENGHLPLTLGGNSPISGIEYRLPVASAQVKSCILLAALGACGQTTVIEKWKTRNHTEILLRMIGGDLRTAKGRITVSSLQRPLRPFRLVVPGDSSTAAYFASAAALMPGSEIVLKGILMNPLRTGLFDALERMGGDVRKVGQYHESGERVGDIRVTPRPLKGITLAGGLIPRMIDEIPLIAVLATQAAGTTVVGGAEELRVKESDRIKAICVNLKRMGANVHELEDGFAIDGPTSLQGASITTFSDHRVAMAFAIAGLISKGQVTLDDPDCTRVSCPEFGEILRKALSKDT